MEASNAFLDEDDAARRIGVPVGRCVLIAMTDTGNAARRRERAFDPFFGAKQNGIVRGGNLDPGVSLLLRRTGSK